ncbi:MAG: fatty acid synthase, partial [Bradymonadia bacterium]
MNESRPAAIEGSLIHRLASDERAIVTFAGQGLDYVASLSELRSAFPGSRRIIGAALQQLDGMASDPRLEATGRWRNIERFERVFESDDPAAWMPSAVSYPLIFLTQALTWEAARRLGLNAAITKGNILGFTGHSQGMLAACFAATLADKPWDDELFAKYLRIAAWQGIWVEVAFVEETGAPLGPEGTTPMLSINGLRPEELDALLDGFEKQRGVRLHVPLRNGRERHVVGGTAPMVAAFQEFVETHLAKRLDAKKKGLGPGRAPKATFEYLPLSAAFHTPCMAAVESDLVRVWTEDGLDIDPSAFCAPVHRCVDGAVYGLRGAPLEDFAQTQCSDPVNWVGTLDAMSDAYDFEWVIDGGPALGLSGLSKSILRGRGVEVVEIGTAEKREMLGGSASSMRPLPWSAFLPRVETDASGEERIVNRFTEAAKRPPMILPGMTPTTVDAGIVAAAANAGYMAELAGGGQVNRAVFEERVKELGELLEPGAEVVFNALYLDRYLWDLHVAGEGLLLQFRRRGAPFCGITISAGMPEPDEAKQLLDTFRDAGLWLNAFKPGTVAQAKQVVAIAKEAADHTVFVHLEGGKAGGHHSWEDLDDLLLGAYGMLRAQPNVVLCVGGGVRDEARAAELLTGQWSLKYGRLAMPVDAILLGTVTMAVKEATATMAVKVALANAPGTDSWVSPGRVEGAVTSGKSQLDADIHYLDNAASRCGRLLDAVAGDADKVAARREEIIDALNQTAKPYLGDVCEMSWIALLERLVSLMAIGEHGRYEDGVWLDPTWRARVWDVLGRAVARVEGALEERRESSNTSPACLNDPSNAVAELARVWPELNDLRPTPSDEQWFLSEVCRRSGKPVCFVPVIDEDVRRWYKSDSLWQAQHGAYAADQVLVIPGPEAVTGIEIADEPVADVLERYTVAARDAARTCSATARPVQWPEGVDVREGEAWRLRFSSGVDPRWRGAALAAFPSETTEVLGAPAWFDGNRPVSNPLHTMIAGLAGDVLRATETGWRYEPDSAEGEFVDASRHGGGVVVTVHMGADTPKRVFELEPVLRGGDRAWVLDSAQESATQAAFLAASMGGASPMPATALFETAGLPVRVEREAARLYARATGLRTPSVPDGLLFSIAWPAVFSVLSAPEIMEGFEKLVHAQNKVERGALDWNASLQLEVRVERVADGSTGREVDTVAVFREGDRVAATMRSRFFIRGDFGGTEFKERRHERWDDEVTLSDAAAVTFLAGIDGVNLSSDEPGALRVKAEGRFLLARHGAAHATASGTIERAGAKVGQIDMDTNDALAMHPLRAALETLGVHARQEHARPVKSLATGTDRAPSRMDAFARAGGDFNPIHRNLLYARYAGFERPIVHGMWTAARLDAFVRDEVLSGNVAGPSECQTEFLSPLLPGETIAMSCERVGLCDAGVILEATASAVRGDGEVAVARTRSVVATPKTAWIFPGQGIQRQGMGLEAMQRSAAARNVWTRADAYTRDRHGFSILNIVRDNPTSLDVRGVQMKHPAGVLHLTQFTQVGLAVLAQAQVAELRESGLAFDGDITCGHSVGEYNALAALAQVITLEAGIDAVYRRGLAMHQLVPRNDRGESGYAMSVVRPHYAGLNHAGAEELVRRINATTGEFIEIVNFNVKGRQYSVTGTTAALQHMHDALDELSPSGGKPAWIQVPGIDVPFHSRALREGVTAFRDALQDTLAMELDVSPLIGRYIPNLVPRLFSLSREYVTEVAEYSSSPILAKVLTAWTDAPPTDLGRTLLIELLAYQFASPVRWIETQDMLFGQLGVERIVEVGLGSQPTLANMARYTQRLLGGSGDHVQVLNAEADDAVVRYADAGLKAAETAAPTPVPAAPAAGSPVVESAAPVAAPAPATAVGKPAEREGSVLDSLRVLLANQAKVAIAQVSDTETIEDLFDGVSARRNQALMDIGAEFAVGSVDGAHEKPLTALASAIEARGGTGSAAGKYLRATQDGAVQRFGARANLGRSAIEDILSQRYGLEGGWANLVLSRLALDIRPGNSARGGELGSHPDVVPADKNAATAVLDDIVAATGRSFGATLGPLSAGGAGAGGAAVDAAVVRELEEKVLGPDGTLAGWARDLLGRIEPTQIVSPSQPDAAHAIAARIIAEFGEDFVDWISPKFEHKKHVVFSHAWSHAQRDVIALYADASNGRGTAEQRQSEASRLSGHATNPRVAGAARWAASRATSLGHTEAAALLNEVAEGGAMPPLDWSPTRPMLHWETGGVRYEEVARDQTCAGQVS